MGKIITMIIIIIIKIIISGIVWHLFLIIPFGKIIKILISNILVIVATQDWPWSINIIAELKCINSSLFYHTL